MPHEMGFNRMQAYQLAREFYAILLEHSGALDWRERHWFDQLLRAASSTCLNIAEGAGEFSRPEKNRFYRMARRSAWECSSAVDLLTIRPVRERAALRKELTRLNRIAALLTTMIMRGGGHSKAPPGSTV